jgi:hypothetical protein
MSAARTARRAAFAAGAAATLFAASGLGVMTVSAATNGSLSGSIVATALPGVTPIQLLTGTDGSLWFLSSTDQVGRIAANGQATLTGATLPAGNYQPFYRSPASSVALIGAASSGAWGYSNSLSNGGDSCTITFASTSGTVTHPHLPSAAAGHVCAGGAEDTSGNVWVSLADLHYGCGCRVGLVAEITASFKVTLFGVGRPGAIPGDMSLAPNGAADVLEGYNEENIASYTPSRFTGGATFFGSFLGMWARPDGSFWLTAARDCAHIGFCSLVALRTAGGSFSTFKIFPVGNAASGQSVNDTVLQLALAPDGTLWKAGHELSGRDRFFRMNASGTIDHSAALPSVSGKTLVAQGPIAVTPGGAVWTIASAGSLSYTVRFTIA